MNEIVWSHVYIDEYIDVSTGRTIKNGFEGALKCHKYTDNGATRGVVIWKFQMNLNSSSLQEHIMNAHTQCIGVLKSVVSITKTSIIGGYKL